MLTGPNAVSYDFNKIKGNPDFLGVKKVYAWNTIEKTEGVYDFSEIEQDLAYLQSIGKRLLVQLGAVTYNGCCGPRTPSYMWMDPKYGNNPPYYGAYPRFVNQGWYPFWWNQNVQNRLTALYAALGSTFNKEPYGEGGGLDETSVEVPPG